MSSKAIWTPPKALREMLERMGEDINDFSPAMEKVSRIGFEDVVQRLSRGGDEWPELSKATIRRHGPHRIGVGEHGGFIPTLRRDWSKRNAVVFTKAPHAHLFEEGTASHSVGGKKVRAYKSKGKHVSAAATRKILATGKMTTRQPSRPFMYFSENVKTRAGEIILNRVFDAFEGRAA